MTELPPGYIRTANTVLRVVREFKRANPSSSPRWKRGAFDRVAFIGTVGEVGRLLAANSDAVTLVEMVAHRVPEATWSMLRAVITMEYSS